MGYLQISISDDDKRYLKALAEQKKLSASQMFIEGAELIAWMDKDFISRARKEARDFGLTLPMYMQSICIAFSAKKSAYEEVYGHPKVDDLFLIGDNGLPLPAMEQWEMLKSMYKKDLEKERKEQLKEDSKYRKLSKEEEKILKS